MEKPKTKRDGALRRVMLDIETISVRPYAAIIEIAAVEMGPSEVTGRHFTTAVRADDCLARRLRMDRATLLWWLKQNGPAPGMCDGDPALDEALARLTEFLNGIRDGGAMEVWAKSPSFDCERLKEAYGVCDLEVPWDYWEQRDVRTLLAEAAEQGLEPSLREVAHDAYADAVAQTEDIYRAWRFLRPEPELPIKHAGLEGGGDVQRI